MAKLHPGNQNLLDLLLDPGALVPRVNLSEQNKLLRDRIRRGASGRGQNLGAPLVGRL